MEDRTCNRCNRPLVGRQTKYCSHACANRTTAKAVSMKAQAKPWNTCHVEGCDKPARDRVATMCPMHYHRVYRYGSLNPVHPPRFTDVTGRRFGTLVVMSREGNRWLCRCDCGETRTTRLGDLNMYGDSSTCGVKRNHLSDSIDYAGAHCRVNAQRGPAKHQRCVDCKGQAKHWSYDHADPDERISQSEWTKGVAYSLDPDHYEPRCVPCHKRFDLGHINSTLHLRVAL